MAPADTTQHRDVLAQVPGIPRHDDTPVFAEPWQAQAFAMAVALQQRGVFTWGEWAQAIRVQIDKALARGDPDDGSTYYDHWMATLEQIVAEKGLTDLETLGTYAEAWGRAADRTPHGEPIELEARDFG